MVNRRRLRTKVIVGLALAALGGFVMLIWPDSGQAPLVIGLLLAGLFAAFWDSPRDEEPEVGSYVGGNGSPIVRPVPPTGSSTTRTRP